MISQTDTQTLGSTNTDTTNLVSSKTNVNLLQNGKGSKGFGVKKKKKFDETVIDGFAILAFKTWEDLQDELEERNSLSNNTNGNNSNNNSNITNATNSINNNFNTNCTAHKKANFKKSKHKNSSSNLSTISANSESSLSNSSTTSISPPPREGNGKKSKDKSKKSASNSQSVASSKDKRNKSSSEKTSLKRALEAKDLAEKHVSILQEKLKQEQSKNRSHDNNPHQTTPNIQETYSSPQLPPSNVHIKNDSTHPMSNGVLGHESLPDHQIPKQAPYSPFHFNSHLHRPPDTVIHQSIHTQIHQKPASPPRVHNNHSQSQHQHNLKHHSHSNHSIHQSSSPHTMHQINQHQSQKPSSPPPSQPHLHQPNLQYPRPPQPSQQTNPLQQNNPLPPPHAMPQTHSHLLHPSQPSPLNPYSHPPATSMMSSMGLGSFPSPYSCPPSIYITDTISRQTSIIPPIVPALEQSSSLATNRYGHSGVMHSVTPYTPPVPPHHSMYYPTLPTERSFIEFARSYTGPGHMGYQSMMSSLPTPSSHAPTNPYNFDRWPRIPLDHQRAVSRYNSLYQSTTAIPSERPYAGYPLRPPVFPAGLFPPPF